VRHRHQVIPRIKGGVVLHLEADPDAGRYKGKETQIDTFPASWCTLNAALDTLFDKVRYNAKTNRSIEASAARAGGLEAFHPNCSRLWPCDGHHQ